MGNSPPKRAAAIHELDRFTHPTGLYPSCPWDVRLARRLIIEKRIAPRFPGREAKEGACSQECPICFMFYPGSLNVATCCKKPMCSECYLQLKPPKKAVCCPYCQREAFSVKYSPPAVMNLANIYSADSSYTARSSPETSQVSPVVSPTTVMKHFASAEDRDRLRDDLRSQLNLTDQRLTAPLPPQPISQHSASFLIASAEDAARGGSQPRYIIASASEAARLEEMMLLEAIRRSMRDLNAAKDDTVEVSASASASSDDDDAAESYEGDADTLRPSRVAVQRAETQRREAASRWNP